MVILGMNIGVFLGGISAERDVSLESGRNVFEKINSRGLHKTIPIFVTGQKDDIKLFIIPLNLIFKDNSDLILESINNQKKNLTEEDYDLKQMLNKYIDEDICKVVTEISFDLLPKIIDFAFIALHGSPGEDGTFQKIFDKLKIPYNGSSAEVSELAMNKFLTNRFLAKNEILVADQYVVDSEDWIANKYKIIEDVLKKFSFPFIVKPVDEGSSVGVMLIENSKIFEHYFDAVFLIENHNEEFKNIKIIYHKKLMIETFIEKGNAKKILEITGGFLTHKKNGIIEYEMFSPSESIANNKILSMEEKFLSGEGINITPARYDYDHEKNLEINEFVKEELKKVATLLNLTGYSRIDAFVKIFENKIEVWIIEINTLPALTPATCIFHQCILNGYTPSDFIHEIINFSI